MKTRAIIAVLLLAVSSAWAIEAKWTNGEYVVYSLHATDTNAAFSTVAAAEAYLDDDPDGLGRQSYMLWCLSGNLGSATFYGWSGTNNAEWHPIIVGARLGAQCGGINVQVDYLSITGMIIHAGLGESGVISANGGQNWTVDGCTIVATHTQATHGISLEVTPSAVNTNVTVQNCVITGPFSVGIYGYAGNDFGTNPRIQMNLYNNTVDGARVYGVQFTETVSGPGTPKAEGTVWNCSVTGSGTQDYRALNSYGGALNGTITASYDASGDTSVTNIASVGILTNVNPDAEFIGAEYGLMGLRVDSQFYGAGTNAVPITWDKDGKTRHDPPTIGAYATNAPTVNPVM